MQNARLDEAQTGIKIAGRNINNLRYADDTTLMAESEEELKILKFKKIKKNTENVKKKLKKKKERNVFLEFSCFFHDPVDVGNLISGSSAFSKTSLNIWKFTVHIFKPRVHA